MKMKENYNVNYRGIVERILKHLPDGNHYLRLDQDLGMIADKLDEYKGKIEAQDKIIKRLIEETEK